MARNTPTPGHFINPGEDRDFVFYELKSVPSKAGEKGDFSAYAKAHPTRSYSLGQLLQRMALRYHGIQEIHAKMVMDALLTTITEVLREGNRVTIGNFLSITPTIRGRFDPEDPSLERKMRLHPAVRCSQAFIRDLNKGVHYRQLPKTEA